MIKIFLLVAIFIIARCNTSQDILYLGNDNNGQQIKISQNEEIVLSLDANPTTGYTWSVSIIDENILKQVQEVEYKASSHKMGSPGKQIFRFQAVTIGQTDLKLIYHRPWETEVEPIDTYNIKINVIKN